MILNSGDTGSLFSEAENEAAISIDGEDFVEDETIEEQEEGLDPEESEEADETAETDDEEEAEQNEDSEQATKYQELNENLNKALKSERDKRKEVSKKVKELETQAALNASGDSQYEASFNKLLEQIKELDLQDILDVPELKKQDPAIQKLLEVQAEQERQQGVQTFFSDMRTEVEGVVSDYPNIDKTSTEQGAILSQMIVSNVSANGMEMEDAVASALSALNGLLESTVTRVKKARKPEVRPRKKIREATPVRKKSTASRQAEKGDFSGVFGNLAERLLDK